jgi:tetratricopeptide (TPR) repeat protein
VEKAARESAAPESLDGPQRRRMYTPISGFETFGGASPQAHASPATRGHLPDIPRAPALPQFRDNSAPPSYAPNRATDHDAEALRSKSLLPRNAGRYSEAPGAREVLKGGRHRPSHPPRAPGSVPPGEPRGRETVPQTPDRIRSGTPPSASGALPTLFEIASWIDAGRHRDAIAAINRAGPGAGPEYAVLRARALAGAGYVDQATDALEKLENAPLLEPELRAACARLFVELGDPARALRIAARALDADPERPLVRLTYVLAAVRASRRRPDEALLAQADRTLERLGGREGPMPALYQSLKACIEAGSGDAERAISIAQRALGLDPRSTDALAAIAEASARLGRVTDARQAWARLHDVSSDEAEALATSLSHMGVGLGARAAEPAPKAAQEVPLWAPIELDLAAGKRTAALRFVEQAAHDAVRRMAKSASQSGLTATATVAASFLTTTPVLSSFAPFDVSLWSLKRVEAAIDVLYGRDRRPALPTDDAGLILLLGSYVGETLRLSLGGHWEGRVVDLDSARVVIGQRPWHPFRVVKTRLHEGRRASIGDALHPALSTGTTEPWRARIPNPVAPPVPWAPHAWPKPSQIGQLGRSLPKSPVGKYCEDFAEGPLDRTIASLIALDTYLDLVAPRDAPTDADSAWTRRLSVLVGGYVGETLRELVGGEWIYGVDAADDAHAYKLQLRGTVEALPVAHVLERVIGERSSSLVDYAKTLLRRAGRS